ncbi:hypothetical protein FSP39_011779 [Pinctada imbricata]|uniref:Uncharacterized protein n=1 Tax=Pinctada imbricata TaxID=66713 RepID=A0AA88YV20_PINIB|nr:hypothetical protein FSP39_011779 [Pinctada imbricata]
MRSSKTNIEVLHPIFAAKEQIFKAKLQCIGCGKLYLLSLLELVKKFPARGLTEVPTATLLDTCLNSGPAYAKCGLSCKALYYGFYVQLESSVPNGVTCDPDGKGENFCVEGKCLKVGCDGIIGSGAVTDRCGICKGDGSSCQLISGIFTRTSLPYGYNLITRIPAGACNINITEMGRSRNYLAMRKSDGSYIFNGNFRLSSNGDYKKAGTTFKYRRNQGPGCPGECVHAEGPVNNTIDVLVLSYRRNPGIIYQFTVSKHMSKDDMTRIIPRLRLNGSRTGPPYNQPTLQRKKDVRVNQNQSSRNSTVKDDRNDRNTQRVALRQSPVYVPSRTDTQSAQSLTLDGRGLSSVDRASSAYDPYRGYYDVNRWRGRGGNQRQALTAQYGRQYNTARAVGDQNGIPLAVPLGGSINTGNGIPLSNNIPGSGQRLSAQNIPDGVNFIWKLSGFTKCSRTCGGGIQQAKAVCMSRDSYIVVTDDNCVPSDKPKLQTVRCNTRICPPGWTTGEWSSCSVSCGRGVQSRDVLCKQTVSSRQEISLPSSRCGRRDRPVSVQTCTGKPCASWEVGDWKKCSTVCGKGTKSRDVVCKSIDGVTVPDSQCLLSKPINEELCDMGTCAEGWFFSKWSSNCTTDCGRGHYTRTVYCSAKDGTPLDEKKCNGSRPRDRKPCKNKHPCGGYWFEGPWSSCSSTCGEGNQTRNIVCIKKLGEKLFAIVGEENCAGRDKPTTTRSCGKLPACPSEWFMTEWSQCSASCGTGTKTRSIKCLSANLTASDTCPKRKPRHRSMCNRRGCEQPQLDEDCLPPNDPRGLNYNGDLAETQDGQPCGDWTMVNKYQDLWSHVS